MSAFGQVMSDVHSNAHERPLLCRQKKPPLWEAVKECVVESLFLGCRLLSSDPAEGQAHLNRGSGSGVHLIEETAIRHFARREESRDHLALGVEDVGVEIDLQAGHRPERSGLHFEGVELLFGRGADSYCLTALVRSGAPPERATTLTGLSRFRQVRA